MESFPISAMHATRDLTSSIFEMTGSVFCDIVLSDNNSATSLRVCSYIAFLFVRYFGHVSLFDPNKEGSLIRKLLALDRGANIIRMICLSEGVMPSGHRENTKYRNRLGH